LTKRSAYWPVNLYRASWCWGKGAVFALVVMGWMKAQMAADGVLLRLGNAQTADMLGALNALSNR
jgi:hypothetical protein